MTLFTPMSLDELEQALTPSQEEADLEKRYKRLKKLMIKIAEMSPEERLFESTERESTLILAEFTEHMWEAGQRVLVLMIARLANGMTDPSPETDAILNKELKQNAAIIRKILNDSLTAAEALAGILNTAYGIE